MNILNQITEGIKNIFSKKQELGIGGVYTFEVYDSEGNFKYAFEEHNIVPDEGLKYALGAMLSKTSPVANFYIGLYTGNYTPVAGDTAATFPANATEFSGYTAATRVLWDLSGTPSITSTTISNTGLEAAFTLNTTATIVGAFISTASAKGAVTGILLSAIKFPAAKGPLNSGDTIKIGYGLTVISQ